MWGPPTLSVMRITTVLPALSPDVPIGGYKVHYEYANRLSGRGHDVTVVHPFTFEPRPAWSERIRGRRWMRGLQASPEPLVAWFRFDPAVRVETVPWLHPRFLPDSEVIIATAWETAACLRHTPARLGGRAYVVYDYEHWMLADEPTRQRIGATFRDHWHIGATSPSVEAMLGEHGVAAAATMYAGIDFEGFGLDVDIAARSGRVVGFPDRHAEPSKGTADAIEAVTLLREERGDDVEIIAFGRRPSPGLPSWVRFVKAPSDPELRALYNSVGTFVLPSHFEGWGLPGVEAMACGAALVAADSVGNRDYARQEETALVVPRMRPDLLAAAIGRLMDDEPLRRRLAAHGHDFVQRYTWDAATDVLETMLLAAAGASRNAAAG